ncbi:hypothetical protein, partial [Streptomyces sp. NPDC017993]|uniref:hypothetical protein n=1 Tax=Streptomyces sp. NPDC017993 TaxID=3365027 RepID=UPI0037A5C24E
MTTHTQPRRHHIPHTHRHIQPIPLTLKGIRRQIHPTRTTPLEKRPPIDLNPHDVHPAQCRYGRLLLTPALPRERNELALLDAR